MRNIILSAVGFVLGAGSVANAFIGICDQFTYADGGLYCRDNSAGACVGDLGNFPTRRSFPWYVEWGRDGNGDGSLYLVESNGARTYTRFNDKLYLDGNPGAFAPLKFTPDNSTLAPGESSFAWVGAYGIILYTPTGNIMDATYGGTGTITGSGFALVDVPGYLGLRQAYWNQTLFDEVRAGRANGRILTMCHGEYSPTAIIQGDRP